MMKDTREGKADSASIQFVVGLSSFLAPFMGSALNVALPAIEERFSLDAVALGWVVASYILAAAVLLLPCGRLADIYGRKRMFLYGMAVYTVGSLLSAIVPSAALLLVARVINGAGAAMGFATGTAILMSSVPSKARGRVLGWNVACVYLGLALGPVLGGMIAHDLGWRWIFGISALAGSIAVLLILWKMRGEWAGHGEERFDVVGSFIYGIALISLIYGCSLLPLTTGAALILAGFLGFLFFVMWELRTAAPLFDVAIFRANRVFAYSNVAALINYSATSAVGFLLSLYLQYTKGLKPHEAGLVLVAQPIMMAVFSPIAGRLSDRIEPGTLASLGMALVAAGLTAFCFLRETTSLWLIVSGLGTLGLGFALFASPNTNAVMSSVEPKYYGVASGTLGSMRLIGQMLSMAVVMMILALFMGRVRITAENYDVFGGCVRVTFGVCAALCVLGVVASSVRGKRQIVR